MPVRGLTPPTRPGQPKSGQSPRWQSGLSPKLSLQDAGAAPGERPPRAPTRRPPVLASEAGVASLTSRVDRCPRGGDVPAGRQDAAVEERHAAQQDRGVGLVDGELVLHRRGREPDLVRDQTVPGVGPPPDQHALNRVGPGEVEVRVGEIEQILDRPATKLLARH